MTRSRSVPRLLAVAAVLAAAAVIAAGLTLTAVAAPKVTTTATTATTTATTATTRADAATTTTTSTTGDDDATTSTTDDATTSTTSSPTAAVSRDEKAEATATPGSEEPPSLPEPPRVSAKAWAVYDATDDEPLAGRGTEEPRPVASLTKLMTALVVVERTQGDELVPVSSHAEEVGEGSEIGMTAGQKYTVDTLLDAMLVYSANDAAVALAEHVGGSEEHFIELMNERAERLELGGTTFTSVNGLDPEGEGEITTSTPSDVIALADVALRDPRIRAAVAKPKVTVARPGTTRVVLENRNPVLTSYRGVDGVKTGHTDEAGFCLLTHFDDGKGGEYYTVVLGERDEQIRTADTRHLLDWARSLRPTLRFAVAGDPVGSAPVAYSPTRVELFVSDDVRASVRLGRRVEERIVVPRVIEPPLRAGDEVGTYSLLVGGKKVASSPIYVDRAVRAPTRSDRLRALARRWPQALRSGVDETKSLLHRFLAYWGFA